MPPKGGKGGGGQGHGTWDIEAPLTPVADDEVLSLLALLVQAYKY
jgi:hypothetical protein